jgi:hypothetical protein
MGVVVIGAIILVIGVALIYSGRRAQTKTNVLRSVATSNAADVATLLPDEMVEVKGTIRCDTPLTSQHAQKPCIWYSSSVTREYEEQTRDSKGELQTSRGSETVSSMEQAPPFFVEDASGRVAVNPDRAEFDAPTLVDRFDQSEDSPAVNVSIGGVQISGGGRRTIGYRYLEKALVVDTPIYVLGAVQENGVIGDPRDHHGGKRLLISVRSEEAIEQSLAKSAHWQAYGGLGTAAVGAALFIIGLVRMALR